MIGPLISELIVQYASWRWIFLSVPVLATVAALIVLSALRGIQPVSTTDAVAPPNPWRKVWALGAASSLLLLHHASHLHGATAIAWWAAAIVLLIVCARRLLPAGTLRGARGVPAVVALRGAFSASFFGTEVYLPLLRSQERGMTPTAAGMVLMLSALGWSTGSWCRGRMTARSLASVLQFGMGLIASGVIIVASAVFHPVPVVLARPVGPWPDSAWEWCFPHFPQLFWN